LASVYRYAVPFNLTEIMRTAVALETRAQPTSFCGGSQELEAKICIMQARKRLSADRKYATFTGRAASRRDPARTPQTC
jgi:hypothetical protein